MDAMLTDKTAVVTGGSSGLGRAIALTFAEHGADVVIADKQEEPRKAAVPTQEAIEARTSRDATFTECDVTNPEELETAVAVADQLGGIDVMVNNAGILAHQDFLDISYDDYRALMDVNAAGVFFGSQAAARKMVENDSGGAIINMSSIAGISGRGGLTTYCASKGAVRLMTYAIADELSPNGIRVNALHPGTVNTSLTSDDLGLFEDENGDEASGSSTYPVGEPANVADCALFLASDMATFVNGASLVVDGGRVNFY